MSGQGLPPGTLYPIIFSLISLVVIVLFIGLSLAVRQQNRRNERYISFLHAQVDQRLALEVHKPRPEIYEVVGEEEKHVALGGKPQSSWKRGMTPASILPLPHAPGLRVLPSTSPPLILSAIILQPRPPRNPTNPNFPDDDLEDDDDFGPLGDEVGVEVDLGMETVDVEGDWRKVVGKTDLGFEFF